jgi:hypothetical protein
VTSFESDNNCVNSLAYLSFRLVFESIVYNIAITSLNPTIDDIVFHNKHIVDIDSDVNQGEHSSYISTFIMVILVLALDCQIYQWQMCMIMSYLCNDVQGSLLTHHANFLLNYSN